MNHAKKSIPSKLQKKINKEIRSAQNPSFAAASLVQEKEEQRKKALIVRAPKHGKKISKRTTPGEVPSDSSPPKSTYPEGVRWIKTLEKQTLNQSRRLTKKLSKKAPTFTSSRSKNR